MLLEERAPRDAEGSVLAHAVALGRRRLSKGTALDAAAIAALADAGIDAVEVAVPEPGDVPEDEAARRCAAALVTADTNVTADTAATGRTNLRAGVDGLFLARREGIDALNAIDPRLTVATLPDTVRVRERELVATVKVIPFFVPAALVERWERSARSANSLHVAPWTGPWGGKRIAHISTVLPGTKGSVLDKTRRALAARIDGTGAVLLEETRVPHERDVLATSIHEAVASLEADVVIVFGASAVTDAADVVPSAIERAGGGPGRAVVHRVGMPVDPGNLLVWGEVDGAIVIGAPGCARSPARNGFDWALDRALAGVNEPDAIAGLGVGGLLKETPRGRPREGDDEV